MQEQNEVAVRLEAPHLDYLFTARELLVLNYGLNLAQLTYADMQPATDTDALSACAEELKKRVDSFPISELTDTLAISKIKDPKRFDNVFDEYEYQILTSALIEYEERFTIGPIEDAAEFFHRRCIALLEGIRVSKIDSIIKIDEPSAEPEVTNDGIVKAEDINIDGLFTDVELFLITSAMKSNISGGYEAEPPQPAMITTEALISVFADARPAEFTATATSAEPETLSDDEKELRERKAKTVGDLKDLVGMAIDDVNGEVVVGSIGIIIFEGGGHLTQISGGPSPTLIYGICQQLILDTHFGEIQRKSQAAFEQMQAHIALANSSNLPQH